MDVREALVQAGVELLDDRPLAALSLRRIAQHAGVSHGAPRHHFPTFESLLAAIARTGVEDLDRELAPILAFEDRDEALRGAALAYLGFARRRPGMFDLISRHDLLGGAGGGLRQITGRWFGDLTRLLDGDGTRALALWSGVHGLAVLASRRTAEPVTDQVPSPESVVALLVDRL